MRNTIADLLEQYGQKAMDKAGGVTQMRYDRAQAHVPRVRPRPGSTRGTGVTDLNSPSIDNGPPTKTLSEIIYGWFE